MGICGRQQRGRPGKEGSRAHPLPSLNAIRPPTSTLQTHYYPLLDHAPHSLLSLQLKLLPLLLFASACALHPSNNLVPSPSSSHRSFLLSLPPSSNLLPHHHRQRILSTPSWMGGRFQSSLHQGSTRIKVQGQETQQDRLALRKGSRDGR